MSWTGYEQSDLEKTISNDGFFPDLSLGDFIRDYRIAVEYETEAVEHHLIMAVLDINTQLAGRRDDWEAGGAENLEDVEQDTLGDIKALVEHYKRACYAQAKATLFGLFNSMVQKSEAENGAKTGEDNKTMWQTISRDSLSALLGNSSRYHTRIC